jgi:hypothetical protein
MVSTIPCLVSLRPISEVNFVFMRGYETGGFILAVFIPAWLLGNPRKNDKLFFKNLPAPKRHQSSMESGAKSWDLPSHLAAHHVVAMLRAGCPLDMRTSRLR